MYKIKSSLIIAMVCFLIIGFGRIAFAVGQSSGQASKASQSSSGSSQSGTGSSRSNSGNGQSGTGSSQSSSSNGQGLSGGQTTEQGKGTSQMNENMDANQVRNEELKRNIEQVRAKNGETTIVRTKIIDCSEEIKIKIQNKLQKRNNISTEDMLRYKAMIQTLSQERERVLNEHQGKIQEQVALLSKARLEGNIEAANTAIMNIKTEQQLRLDELTKVLKSLEDFDC